MAVSRSKCNNVKFIGPLSFKVKSVKGTVRLGTSNLESCVDSFSISIQHHQAPAVKKQQDPLPSVNTDEVGHSYFHFILYPMGYVDEQSKRGWAHSYETLYLQSALAISRVVDYLEPLTTRYLHLTPAMRARRSERWLA